MCFIRSSGWVLVSCVRFRHTYRSSLDTSSNCSGRRRAPSLQHSVFHLNRRIEIGKPRRATLSKTVWRFKGAKSREVLSGPSFGVDVSVLKLSDKKVMIANCDPISLLPEFGSHDSAIMSVREVAADVATCGHPAQYAMFSLNLPHYLADHTLREYWGSISSECLRMGISIVGGHTGRFEGCDYPIVGSGTMWCVCDTSEYLTSAMLKDGDDIILTKSAAFGATAFLARAFPNSVRKSVGSRLFREASGYFPKMDVVNDCILAVRAGIHERGITAIHNVSEGGVFGAVFEMAAASSAGCILDIEEIPVSDATNEICRLFRIDPMECLGEGSLLLACRPDRTKQLIRSLKSNNVRAGIIGHVSFKLKGVSGLTKTGRVAVQYPSQDPYWRAYLAAKRKGWS